MWFAVSFSSPQRQQIAVPFYAGTRSINSVGPVSIPLLLGAAVFCQGLVLDLESYLSSLAGISLNIYISVG